MARVALVLTMVGGLAGCGGGSPFAPEKVAVIPTAPTAAETPSLSLDPNVSSHSKFAWDPARSLTMNAVTYDSVSDKLVINNLPFDGPEGIYDNVLTFANGAKAYKSRSTETTGQMPHYAVFVSTVAMQATSAAGANWLGYGNSGANVNRTGFRLPAGGEYIYVGKYAATRVFDGRTGLELVTGDLRLIVDVLDFDPKAGVQGDIAGRIFNRTRVFSVLPVALNRFSSTTATQGRALPDVILAEVGFSTTEGSFDNGTAESYAPDTTAWESGTYSGILGGTSGEQIGGYTVITGTADVQSVRYQVQNYTLAGVNGVASGLDSISQTQLQDMLNAGETLPGVLLSPPLPTDAVATTSSFVDLQLRTDYTAREIGVFVGTQVPTTP